MNWHLLKKDDLLEVLDARISGLSEGEAKERLQTQGPNELERTRKKTLLQRIAKQLSDFMTLVLIVAAAIAGFIGDPSDALIIAGIVVLNAVIGLLQEQRAEQAVEALRSMAAPVALVRREGRVKQVPGRELVPGDCVLLEAGNVVAADIRLLEVHSLRVQESALTGEAEDVAKKVTELEGDHLAPGDRVNMAYKSTFVTHGRAEGVVVQTGMNTEVGRIARLLQGEEGPTPLQKKMADFGRKLSFFVLAVCLVIFLTGWLRGEEPFRLLLTAISLAVAAIPEALPAVITVSLALGAGRMVRRQALIRKLPAVETLGSVTYICTDKTGTLTQNKMQVTETVLLGNAAIQQELFLLNLALSNEVQADGDKLTGDSTEVALVQYAAGKGRHKQALKERHPAIVELPFDSVRKRMSTLHRYDGRYLLLVKGAAESLLEQAATDTPVAHLHTQVGTLAARGYRVLAHGYRWIDSLPEHLSVETLEKDLTLCGLTGIIDPPRPEAAAAIAQCYAAGMQPVMITGDHPQTAKAIAESIGLLRPADEANEYAVITGAQLAALPWNELLLRVKSIRVYARVSPEQKLNIVKALQEAGQVVSMTGDGVNDAPALKNADIGVAMGITGTDVSKEAAHMVLLDDNFATIPKAVGEGRRIYDNIRKFVKYALASNTGEVLTIFLAPLIGLPIPLLPVHILWMNLMTDGLPGLALSAEKAEVNVMQRPPRHPQDSIFAGGVGGYIVWVGLVIGALGVGTQAWAVNHHPQYWQTIVFNVLCLGQLGHALAVRTEGRTLFSKAFFANRPLMGAVLLSFALQMAITYLPFLQPVFRTVALPLRELLLVLGISFLVYLVVELQKAVSNRLATKK